MGKTQLAFALGGDRPYFYWPATRLGPESQNLYKNFNSISFAFNKVTEMDEAIEKKKELTLNCLSDLYQTDALYTYGFICALLTYYSSRDPQEPQMIRIEEITTFHIDKCRLSTVAAVRDKIVADGKVLPFFILDEMTPNDNTESCAGMKVAAFQRNVFRACGLVVVVMGTDSKITDLVDQSGGSYTEEHMWMSIVSRFPSHQLMVLEDATDQQVWDAVVDKYPVVEEITTHSRGRFFRFFVDSVVACMKTHEDAKLYELLDESFLHVSKQTQLDKRVLAHQSGQAAQLAAISYSVSDAKIEPPLKKRRVGTHCMNLHFANLVDDQLTKVVLKDGELQVDGKDWVPQCVFPDIQDDMLLYLAVLGGKEYSGYYDHNSHTAHSTKSIFSRYIISTGLALRTNTKAVKSDYAAFENMVAHAIFCASRRNGVRGICFNDFFAGLLGELQDECQPMTMTIAGSRKTIVAGDLLGGFPALTSLANATIPFVAPPNARWPDYILNENANGCKFGHLVRAADRGR
ncbi:hypothetical protein V7S43_007452 [Phytophthora oleae]|uniref:Crinkler (CRN) family protein n=1 Tax=Phytophthora oleae TaxID=2107226 RepID=A0ABD3FJY1_9STRA